MSYPEFEKLVQVVMKLRDPENGCPWDLEQTHKSLLKYLLEESYEFIQATESGNPQEMQDELGDVLLQVLLHSAIAEEAKSFSLESVSQALSEKLIRRHPHVFSLQASQTRISTKEVIKNWDEIKKKEREKAKLQNQYELDTKLVNFPALFSANKIGEKTKKLNFDWDNASQVSYKVEEEWQELKEELAPKEKNFERIEEEMGDFLFSAAQLARHLGINPEEALRRANQKFIRRFQKMEDLVKKDSLDIHSMKQDELDQYWSQVKIHEKGQ